MIKYNENKTHEKKGDAGMLPKMYANLKKQFAAGFAVGSVFPFFVV